MLRVNLAFSTALSMRFEGVDAEADFVALHARENWDTEIEPDLIIGEAKSLGEGNLIKAKDLSKLKEIGKKLPGAVLVISVMKPSFTQSEKDMLRSFVNWGRRKDAAGKPTNPVILLTANELFFEFDIPSTWKKLGGRFKHYSERSAIRDLPSFAEATQGIYLDLPSYYEVCQEAWEKRQKRT